MKKNSTKSKQQKHTYTQEQKTTATNIYELNQGKAWCFFIFYLTRLFIVNSTLFAGNLFYK